MSLAFGWRLSHNRSVELQREQSRLVFNKGSSPMERIPVESSILESVGYEPREQLLIIGFRNTSIYAYRGVPEHLYLALLEAPSKGKFFLEHIRDVYEASRV